MGLSPPDLLHSSCTEVVSSLEHRAVHRLTTPLPSSVGVPSPVWITGLSETLGAQAGEMQVTLRSLLKKVLVFVLLSITLTSSPLTERLKMPTRLQTNH